MYNFKNFSNKDYNDQNAHILKETVRGVSPIELGDDLMQKRSIFLPDEITAYSCNELLQQLMLLEEEDNTKEITLYINSPGGEVSSGLGVYDYMRLMKSPIRTVCTGCAASMGSILFLAGDKREMLPHTQIMVHDPVTNMYPGFKKALDLQRRADRLMKTRSTLIEIIAERCGKSLEEVQAITEYDTYLSAQEAVEFGMATHIINSLEKE